MYKALQVLANRPPMPQHPAPLANPPRPGDRIARALNLLREQMPVQRRLVHAGDAIFEAGAAFGHLYVVNSGCVKVVNTAADGRNQVVGMLFRGDWFGFDGIAKGRYGCTAQALDVGEVWALRYATLLSAAATHPELLLGLHAEMSKAINRGRDAMLSLCTLPVTARVAEFLGQWAEALQTRGLRNDQIVLRLSRAEIGNHLGMTLESVSRSLSSLVRANLISFTEKGRRMIEIPDLQRLNAFIQAEGHAIVSTLQ
jgi:CRP/FNR family transcriptional regulator